MLRLENLRVQLGLIMICGMVLYSCNDSKSSNVNNQTTFVAKVDTNIVEKLDIVYLDYDTSQWNEITSDDGIQLDIRYASDNNFTKKQIYNCGRCFLRPEVAQQIKKLHNDIRSRYGFGVKMFDCYRPRPAQQKLWDIVPNAMYVTPPKKGSMHNRGQAVDLTIVDKNGDELDMGTEYDFFGKEAHRTYTHPNKEIQQNRSLHRMLLEAHGFTGIRTEWWHYSLKSVSYDFSDWVWECPENPTN